MTQIINGVYLPNELAVRANGGTEQMAKRMVRDINPDLLQGFQIIHSRIRELDPDLKKVLVLHDLHDDTESVKLADPEYRDQFDKFVFVSNWQLQMYNLTLGVPYSKSVVIPNAIEPFEPVVKDYSGPIRLIYHTTPHRGLNILYPVFERLANEENVHLDVFSSFGVYGWEDRDIPYKDLFDKLDNHPNITNHGAQPNEVVREKLKETHLFTYPSIWPETSCIAAIEAMCSGNMVIHPNFAALPETTAHDSWMYQWNEDINTHANVFYANVKTAIRNIREYPEQFSGITSGIAQRANNYYNWNGNVKFQWEKLLTTLKI